MDDSNPKPLASAEVSIYVLIYEEDHKEGQKCLPSESGRAEVADELVMRVGATFESEENDDKRGGSLCSIKDESKERTALKDFLE